MLFLDEPLISFTSDFRPCLKFSFKTQRKSRSLSPIARMDPHEKQPILSSSEVMHTPSSWFFNFSLFLKHFEFSTYIPSFQETDSEDSIPLSLLSKLQSIVAKRSNKGISIQEPGEQAPTKRTKPSSTQPKVIVFFSLGPSLAPGFNIDIVFLISTGQENQDRQNSRCKDCY